MALSEMSLAAVQAAFRQSPGRPTALAYMDAAIEEWENGDLRDDNMFVDHMRDIRAWLLNERIWS